VDAVALRQEIIDSNKVSIGYGGAVYATHTGSMTFMMSGVNITDSYAKYGGALAFNAATSGAISLYDCYLVDNNAQLNGNAMYLSAQAYFTNLVNVRVNGKQSTQVKQDVYCSNCIDCPATVAVTDCPGNLGINFKSWTNVTSTMCYYPVSNDLCQHGGYCMSWTKGNELCNCATTNYSGNTCSDLDSGSSSHGNAHHSHTTTTVVVVLLLLFFFIGAGVGAYIYIRRRNTHLYQAI